MLRNDNKQKNFPARINNPEKNSLSSTTLKTIFDNV